MKPIRVLLVAIPPMLAELVSQIVAEQPDMEVVGEVTGGVDSLVAVGWSDANVVILALENSEPPGLSSHLLAEYPHIKVLALGRDGQRAFLYEYRQQEVRSREVWLQGLRNMIRSALSSKFLAEGAVNDR